MSDTTELSSKSGSPGGCCLFLGVLNLLGSELALLPDRDECSPPFCHDTWPWLSYLTSVNARTVWGNDKLQYDRKYASYVKASQFFFFISSLFWWHLGCVLLENQVGAPKLADNVSLTAQPDDLLSVGLLHTTSPVQGCGSSLDSAPDSGTSWSECLILFLTLWFPDLVHLERQPRSSGNSPGIWIMPWLSHLLTA